PGADCGRRSGSSGSAGGSDLLNCGNGEWVRTLLLKRQAAPTVRGSWLTARPSLSRCPTLILSPSGFPLWLGARSLTYRIAVYGPVRTVMRQDRQGTAGNRLSMSIVPGHSHGLSSSPHALISWT